MSQNAFSAVLSSANPLRMPTEKSFDEEIREEIIPGLDPSSKYTSPISILIYFHTITYSTGEVVWRPSQTEKAQ
jgi:hypothetical protein